MTDAERIAEHWDRSKRMASERLKRNLAAASESQPKRWAVQRPLELPDRWYTVCICTSLEAAECIVRGLRLVLPDKTADIRIVPLYY